LNAHLNGKKHIVGDKTTLADLACGVALTSALQLTLDGGFRKNALKNVDGWYTNFSSQTEVIKELGKIHPCAKQQKPPGQDGKQEKATPAKAAPKAVKKEDDLDDLFGDEDEDDKAAAA